MNRKYLYVLLSTALFACSSPSEETTETPEAAPSSSELMSAYVDSLNAAANRLGDEYRRILDDAAKNLDSAKNNQSNYRERIQPLKNELERLTSRVTQLMEEKKISEEDYQSLYHEIQLDAVEATAQTLETIGITLQATADSLKN
ncbi:MAG: hypothetical protein LPK45_04990 [Bacteroidota bacterium]|nr:hypothetical protein [Bacteroidota bacterium]MDX5430415.1 hypothetical protein [Bacteroidota bacterium]MDX5469174.1 hypothetical protein [Bacteroidota bacterium]